MTLEELADRMGYDSVSTLARQLNPNDEARRFPASKLNLICEIFDDYSPVDHICGRARRVAIELPEADGKIDHEMLAKVAETSGQAMAKTVMSLEDGRVDEGEKKILRPIYLALAKYVNNVLGLLN